MQIHRFFSFLAIRSKPEAKSLSIYGVSALWNMEVIATSILCFQVSVYSICFPTDIVVFTHVNIQPVCCSKLFVFSIFYFLVLLQVSVLLLLLTSIFTLTPRVKRTGYPAEATAANTVSLSLGTCIKGICIMASAMLWAEVDVAAKACMICIVSRLTAHKYSHTHSVWFNRWEKQCQGFWRKKGAASTASKDISSLLTICFCITTRRKRMSRVLLSLYFACRPWCA